MDPQQWLLLEVAYEAREDAGAPLDRIAVTECGRSGWGETVLGVELARYLVRLDEAVRFIAHVNMVPVLASGPWHCEFVGDGPGPWLSTLLSAHIARHRAKSVVPVGLRRRHASLERLGVDPANLLSLACRWSR
jgi:hypothetical protein